jgi:hypothetical protein
MLKATNEQEYSLRHVFLSLLVIFLCCIISYWPVSAGIFSLKNDAIRYFLPVRFQISDMINHGQFPYWTPYVNLGHPLYTDMQSGVWNPFVWLISLFGNYTMRSLQMELLTYVFLSGVSMFFLLKHFKLNLLVCLTLAVSYMLCGFISDSAQFPYWICGMAFFPFVFLFFHKTLKELSFKAALFFSFSLYLLFVTGYPGEFIIIAWFLFAYLILHIFKNKNQIPGLIKLLSFSIIIFSLFSLPAILAYISGLPFITRGAGVSLDSAMSNSMHPLSLVTYLFPLTGWKLQISETDILGRNSFMGLLTIILLIISFFTKTKNSLLIFFKWVFIVSLLLSLGKYGGLRFITYYILPGMNTFRHPSLFRFLSIFSGVILAAYALQQIFENKTDFSKKKKALGAAILLIIISSIVIIIYNPSKLSDLVPASFTIVSLKNWLEQSSLVNWLIIELIIQLAFLLVIYQYLLKKQNIKAVAFAAILNCLFHTILIQPVTVVSSQTVSSLKTTINIMKQEGYPLPNLNSTINSNSIKDENIFLKTGPVNMYNKKHGYQFGFVTPGPLRTHEKFMTADNLSNILFNFPLLYKADTAFTYTENVTLPGNKKFVLTEDSALISAINHLIRDTIYKVSTQKYSPGEWEFEINSASTGFYCLIQNYYPDWELFINGKKESIYLCNMSLMGFKLASGKNSVKLQFRDNKVKMAFYVHLIAWAALICYIFFLILKRKRN